MIIASIIKELYIFLTNQEYMDSIKFSRIEKFDNIIPTKYPDISLSKWIAPQTFDMFTCINIKIDNIVISYIFEKDIKVRLHNHILISIFSKEEMEYYKDQDDIVMILGSGNNRELLAYDVIVDISDIRDKIIDTICTNTLR